MKGEQLFESMNYLSDRCIMEAVSYFCARPKVRRLRLRTLLSAAVIVSLFAAMAAAAWAVDFLGIRALLRREEGPGGGEISVTVPQELPEREEEHREAVDKNKAAWQEWQQYKRDNQKSSIPGYMVNFPDMQWGSDAIDEIEYSDGSVLLRQMRISPGGGSELIKEVLLSPEEYEKAVENYLPADRLMPDYDHSYRVQTQEEADKLEEIAEKYGLQLRGEPEIRWSSETTGQSGEKYLTNKELTELTAQIGCGGNIFRETPPGFDKMYWYGEGSFGISYYAELPSGGDSVCCYLRNSPYDTLASGREVLGFDGRGDYSERHYKSADGTELTILTGENQAFIYVYLENSYLTEHISAVNSAWQAAPEDIDYIADLIIYSLIGK